MHTSNTWLEKIEFGHFRLHRIEKDRKSIAVMIENGFSATSDNPDEFVKDYHVDDQILNFGITMADCYNQLQKNQGFITAHLHLRSSKPVSAKARKEALDSFSEEELLVASLSLQDLDEFLSTYAENYSKPLVDEAKVHLDKGLDVFAQWLSSDSVEFREDSKQSIADYFALDRERFRDDICKKVFSGWEEAKKNEKAYEEWKDRFENDECWVNFYRSMGLDDESDNVEVDYTYYYCFSGNRVADELFEILNEKDPHYSTQTKRLIHNVLTDRSQKDIEFARELQCKYDEYRDVNGGKERTFITIAADETAKETQQSTPQIEEPAKEGLKGIPELPLNTLDQKRGRHNSSWIKDRVQISEEKIGALIQKYIWDLLIKSVEKLKFKKGIEGIIKEKQVKNFSAGLLYYAFEAIGWAKVYTTTGVQSSFERTLKFAGIARTSFEKNIRYIHEWFNLADEYKGHPNQFDDCYSTCKEKDPHMAVLIFENVNEVGKIIDDLKIKLKKTLDENCKL